MILGRREKRRNFGVVGAVALVILGIGCGGGGSKTDAKEDTYTLTYVNPQPPTGSAVDAPIIRQNTSLSTSKVYVYEVIGGAPSLATRGVVCNLQVDNGKVVFVQIPGENADLSGGGFGGSTTRTKAKLLADGTNLMVTAIRRPGAATAANGVLMRFALSINQTPVAGVVRAEVRDGSGLVSADGKIIPGTSPVLGRLEIVKS